jgi:hypothetical protein
VSLYRGVSLVADLSPFPAARLPVARFFMAQRDLQSILFPGCLMNSFPVLATQRLIGLLLALAMLVALVLVIEHYSPERSTAPVQAGR